MATSMRVFIRTDASRVIGSGHLMRSLALAQALRAGGADVAFITREHPGNLLALIRDAGFGVTALAAPTPDKRSVPGYAAWLGDHWEQDARASAAVIAATGTKPDWLIVDHYGIDASWERALRASVERLFVIDDLADRDHDCDLLLNQNLMEHIEARYEGRVPERCGTMLGPRYALLQPDYAALHGRIAPRRGAIRRLCIYFGSAERQNLTLLALRAFLSLDATDVAADVVAGDPNSELELCRCAANHPRVQVHARLPTLAPLFARADLAVGAAGSASWERLCLGAPALAVSLADNQRETAAALHRRGLITWLGDQEAVGLPELQAALALRLAQGADEAASLAGPTLVDGRGVARVTAALRADAHTPLRIRSATAADEDLLLEWANNVGTRWNSGGRGVIRAEEHHLWFDARLRDPDGCLLLLAETHDGVPVGTVRFDRTDGGWRVNYSLAAAFRGRGLARRMLGLALAALAARREDCWVVGRVLSANLRSHRVFAGLGFHAAGEQNGIVAYRRRLHPAAAEA
jgi:UDP-2,4-diacetamido-2,4,6-trideoxy-beta-L-altropyranose hydrolase